MYYKGLLRTFNFDGYHPGVVTSGTLKIVSDAADYGSEGTVLKSINVSLDQNANFNGEFSLPNDVPFGRYHFEFYAGSDKTPVYNNAEFYVEAYKKPVFKVTVAVPKPDAMLGDSVDYTANAQYYFG